MKPNRDGCRFLNPDLQRVIAISADACGGRKLLEIICLELAIGDVLKPMIFPQAIKIGPGLGLILDQICEKRPCWSYSYIQACKTYGCWQRRDIV